MEKAQLIGLVDAEVAAISHQGLRQSVERSRIVPIPMRCAWDYGEPGQTYECWKVLAPAGNIGIVYCDRGFGPRCPWGLIWQDQTIPEMGQDSGWFPSLVEAAADIFDVPLEQGSPG
jgi:hypothetical protein